MGDTTRPNIYDYAFRRNYRDFLRDWASWRSDDFESEDTCAVRTGLRVELLEPSGSSTHRDSLGPAEVEVLLLEMDLTKREANFFRDLVQYDQGRHHLVLLQEIFDRLVELWQGAEVSAAQTLRHRLQQQSNVLMTHRIRVEEARERMLLMMEQMQQRRLNALFYPPVCSEWYFDAVREMSACPAFRPEPSWIASNFHHRLPEPVIRHTLRTLEGLGLLRRQRRPMRGEQVRVSLDASTGFREASRYFGQMMDRARELLWQVESGEEVQSIGQVNIQAVTVALPEEVIPKVNALLSDAMDQVVTLATTHSEHPDRVFHVQVHVIPLTKRVGTRHDERPSLRPS